jgi:hypothetical protein
VTTSSNSDRGKFKVPTLRNVALKSSFFHDGQRASLSEAIDFYAVEPGPAIGGVFTYAHLSGHNNSQLPNEQFADNQDPIMQTVTLTTQNAQDILAFLQNGLVDPRVATGTFPFDSPVLASQRPLLTPILHGDGRSSGTFVPQVAVRTPAVAGSDSFTVDIAGGRAGAPARLLSWSVPSADGLVHVSDPIVLATDHGATFGSTAVSLADAKAGTRMQFAWMVEDADAPGGFAVSPTASVVVFDQRPRYVAGTPVPSPVSSAVGDGDAYVESAKYVVGLTRTNDQPYTDSFSFVAWMNPAGQAAQPSNGTVSLTLGGAVLLEDAQLDAKGRLSAQGVTGSYNRKTGRLAVTMRGLDLRNAIVTPFSLPIRIEVNGLGLAAPVATTTLNFAAKTGANGVTVGKFAYRASGTGNGVFRATSAHARLVDSGRARLQLTLVVDTPGPLASWTPGSVAISVGAVQPFEYSETALGVSGDGTTYSADRDGDLKKLRIDVIRRTLTLDAVTDVPALTGAAPGTRVDIPVTLTMQPSTSTTPVTFRTTASVTVGRR